jgi:hypothetical protein
VDIPIHIRSNSIFLLIGRLPVLPPEQICEVKSFLEAIESALPKVRASRSGPPEHA